jgi:hypothetical protein
MAFDYNRIVVNTVIPQIADKGKDVILIREFSVDGVWSKKYDPITYEPYWENSETGEISYTEPTGYTEIYTGKALMTNFEEEDFRDTSIQRGDVKLLSIELPAPRQGDVYTVNDIRYVYVNHEKLAPGDTTVLYKIQVRI